jgi:hypothetical protein
MRKMHLVSLLALSLSVLDASAAHAFGTKALFNRLDATENGDFSESAVYLNALLSTQASSEVQFSQSAALTVANASAVPSPQVAVSSLTEGFENVSALAPNWAFVNNSDPGPIAPPATWSQGLTTTSGYASQSGASNSFAQVTFASTAGDGTQANGTISNWLITPELDFSQGGTFSFFARTSNDTINTFSEFLEVRQSTAGSSTNVGTTATSVGDFTSVVGTVGSLTTLGALQSTSWQQFTFSVPATAGTGRLAFRSFATNGGVNGTQNAYITIDTVNFTPAPEPAMSSLAGFAVLGLASYFKGKRKRTIT